MGTRILIVDDDEALRRALARMLRARGYEVDEAGWGVRRADPRGLLGRFLPASDGFANLVCVKTPVMV